MLVTYGRLFSYACQAKEQLEREGISLCVLKLNQIKPVDPGALQVIRHQQWVFFFEEGMQYGGVGEHFGYLLSRKGFSGTYYVKAVDDQFVPQASMAQALHHLGLDDQGMVNLIRKECKV